MGSWVTFLLKIMGNKTERRSFKLFSQLFSLFFTRFSMNILFYRNWYRLTGISCVFLPLRCLNLFGLVQRQEDNSLSQEIFLWRKGCSRRMKGG